MTDILKKLDDEIDSLSNNINKEIFNKKPEEQKVEKTEDINQKINSNSFVEKLNHQNNKKPNNNYSKTEDFK
ncbi:hypothetical protein LDC_1998 [sediment metagenome]|uniref:Uncharacterized protein n=1 Tax=sediment metagenome TaxID=749907 RepID=D9PKD3_9ZZZZ